MGQMTQQEQNDYLKGVQEALKGESRPVRDVNLLTILSDFTTEDVRTPEQKGYDSVKKK